MQLEGSLIMPALIPDCFFFPSLLLIFNLLSICSLKLQQQVNQLVCIFQLNVNQIIHKNKEIRKERRGEKRRAEETRKNKNPLLQGNVWSPVTIPESFFLKIRNTRQTPLNLAYSADSLQDTDHLYFPLMVNQAAMPKVKSASPVSQESCN